MSLTLREVLALEPFQRARPKVLCEPTALDREIRWVHTSELVEAAELLQGGELLLTTGLGLAGRGPVAQRTYVERLAVHGVAALGLELGWTFQRVPSELLRAARDEGLPLIVLREIVPFVELTEEVQRRLVHGQVEELRAHELADRLVDEQPVGTGMWGLVAAVAEALTCPVVFEAQTGQLVAWARADSEAEARRLLLEGRTATTELRAPGHTWGWIHLVDPDVGTGLSLKTFQERVAQFAQVLLGSHGQAGQVPSVVQQRQELLTDLVQGAVHDAETVRARLDLAGSSTLDGGFLGISFSTSEVDTRRLRYVAQAVTSARGGFAVEVDGVVSGIAAHGAQASPRQVGEELLEAATRVMRQQGGEGHLRIAVSELAARASELVEAVPAAREVLRLASRLGLIDPVVVASETSTDVLLAAMADRPELSRLVSDRIGALREYDARYATDLCETLRVYLTSGSSKTTSAIRLGLQRQTVHQRLARIEELIGPIDRADRHVALVLALAADHLARRRGPLQAGRGESAAAEFE
jgi:purine catabolism regulator